MIKMIEIDREDLEWLFKQARNWWRNTLGYDVKNIEKLSELEKKYNVKNK